MASNVKRTSFAQFCGGIEPENFIYEDEQCVVFEEVVNKQAPVHFLVVPRRAIPRLIDASYDDEKLLGRLLIVARRVAKIKGLSESGFRVVINEGENAYAGVAVDEFHIIVFGGRQMGWPFGHMLLVANNVITNLGSDRSGYHLMVDEDFRNQRLKCIHVFGRALHHMIWPVGPGSRL